MNHVIIIGAAKCGTTSLYYMLGQHSQICLSLEKEPDFFGANPFNFNNYSDLWPNYRDNQWALEATTMYTSHPTRYGEIPQTIKRYGINPRFIYLMRNPWDRIESLMRFLPSSSSASYIEFRPEFISGCDYFSRLESYADVFGRASILPIQFEDFVIDPCAVAQRVFSFLDLELETVTPQWVLKTEIQFPQDYIDSSYRKSRRSYAMQQLAPSMQQLAKRWDVDIQRWGF